METFHDKAPWEDNVKYPEGAEAGHSVLTSLAALFGTPHVSL